VNVKYNHDNEGKQSFRSVVVLQSSNQKHPARLPLAKKDRRRSLCVIGENARDNLLALRATPFFKGESGSQWISAEATLRPAFGIQPSASGATVVHFSGEPLRDERTGTENNNQKQ
jgi:hypothetical protein